VRRVCREEMYRVDRGQSFGAESEFQEVVYSGSCACQVMMMKTTTDQRPDDKSRLCRRERATTRLMMHSDSCRFVARVPA
jgi:hypothetical protein